MPKKVDVALQAQALLEYRQRHQIQVDGKTTGPVNYMPFREYVTQAWGVVEPATSYRHNWHIDAISEHLEAVTNGHIQNLIINIPPRHTKSLLVNVFWFTWTWTVDPSKRWLFSSYAENLSIRDSIKCRRVINSIWYQGLWGSVFKLTGDQNMKSRFENDKTGFRLSTSVGGLGTGEGGDVLVVDDPHKTDEAESDAIRSATLNWWDKTMSTRLNDPSTGSKVIIMQRLHEEDLAGHIMRTMEQVEDAEQYETLILPAEYDGNTRVTSIGFSDPRTQFGELLNPDRFDQKTINNLKVSLGSYGASGQLQQNPAPLAGGIFKRHWWRFWYPRGGEVTPHRFKMEDGTWYEYPQIELPYDLHIAQSWDCTFKGQADSDYVVGQVWGRKGSDAFLLDQVRGQMTFNRTLQAFKNLTNKWPESGSKLIEDKANGPAVIQTLQGQVAGVVAVNPQGDKTSRAIAAAPFIEAGNIYLPHPNFSPWVKDFITRFAKFPKTRYDDEVDSLSQIMARWAPSLSGAQGSFNYMMSEDDQNPFGIPGIDKRTFYGSPRAIAEISDNRPTRYVRKKSRYMRRGSRSLETLI